MLEAKKITGRYTYGEALNLCEDGWRLPTIFELIDLAAGNQSEDKDDWYWSISPYDGDAAYAWGISFNRGFDTPCFKGALSGVYLVRGGKNRLELCHAVGEADVVNYKESRVLPYWHE